MFNKKKIAKLEKENKELRKQFLTLTDNYNNYANVMSKQMDDMNNDYNELQKKYLTVISNSLQRDAKTGRYVKIKSYDRK